MRVDASLSFMPVLELLEVLQDLGFDCSDLIDEALCPLCRDLLQPGDVQVLTLPLNSDSGLAEPAQLLRYRIHIKTLSGWSYSP